MSRFCVYGRFLYGLPQALCLILSALQFQLSSGGTAVRLSICAGAVLMTLLVTSDVLAQDADSQPRAEIKMMVGASDFGTDEEAYPHLVVGASSRIRATRHWAIEPEFNYMRRSSNDHDYLFQ